MTRINLLDARKSFVLIYDEPGVKFDKAEWLERFKYFCDGWQAREIAYRQQKRWWLSLGLIAGWRGRETNEKTKRS